MRDKKRSNFGEKVVANAAIRESEKSSYGYLQLSKNLSVYSPDAECKIRLDFIPYEVTDVKHPDRNDEAEIALPGDLWYKRPFYIHRNIGANNETVVCLKSIGKRCPICEYRDKRVKEGADKEELQSLKNSRRNVYVVIPLDSKQHDAKLHVMDISEAMFQKLLDQELKENPSNGIFPDLENGKTVKVRFEAKTIGKGNPFPEADRIDFEERDEQYTEKILAKVPNLDEILHTLSYEELNNKFFEMEDDGKLEEKHTKAKEDDEPVRKKRVVDEYNDEPVRKKKVEVKEDDEPVRKKRVIEDESDETPRKRTIKEEVPEEEKPMRRKTPAKEEQEIPEEKPVRKEKTTSRPECPKGHKFGVDTDKFDDCDSCPNEIWNACSDKKDSN